MVPRHHTYSCVLCIGMLGHPALRFPAQYKIMRRHAKPELLEGFVPEAALVSSDVVERQ